MSDKLLDEKLETVKAKNDELNEKAKVLQEQIAEGQKQLQVIREEHVRLQGEYRALESLKKPEEKPKEK